MPLTTPRLVLEPLRRAHAARLFPVLADARLHAFTGGAPPVSEDALAERYGRLETRRSPDGRELWLNWVLVPRGADGGAAGVDPVGTVQATVAAAHAHVAWTVGAAAQGRGYASEAAAALVAHLVRNGRTDVRACIHPDHVASRRVAERAGLARTDLPLVDGEEVWRRAGAEGCRGAPGP